MPRPLVSVIMPVYNGGPYLQLAINSILEQTLRDFEFLIVDDGSTDNSEQIIKACSDSRIRLVSQKNKGLVVSLNRLVGESRGEYIARMDADDWCHPERLRHQINFMESNPNVGFVGTWVKIIDDTGQPKSLIRYPITDSLIREQSLINCTFTHGSVLMRNNLPIQYSDKYQHAEDYDLWIRLLRVTKAANLPSYLYSWRHNSLGASLQNRTAQNNSAKLIRNSYYIEFVNSNQTISESEISIEVAYRNKIRVMCSKLLLISILLTKKNFQTLWRTACSCFIVLKVTTSTVKRILATNAFKGSWVKKNISETL